MDKQFEELYPEINEHLKTEAGRAILMRVYFESMPHTLLDNLEAKLPKPHYYPVSPNSNPSSINT